MFFNDLPLPPCHCEGWSGIRTDHFDSRSFWQVRSFQVGEPRWRGNGGRRTDSFGVPLGSARIPWVTLTPYPATLNKWALTPNGCPALRGRFNAPPETHFLPRQPKPPLPPHSPRRGHPAVLR